jgi:hypothetical protein
VLETDLEIEELDWESICYKDGVVVVRVCLGGYRSLVFAVEKLLLAAETGLFSSEGHSGAPNFQPWILR